VTCSLCHQPVMACAVAALKRFAEIFSRNCPCMAPPLIWFATRVGSNADVSLPRRQLRFNRSCSFAGSGPNPCQVIRITWIMKALLQVSGGFCWWPRHALVLFKYVASFCGSFTGQLECKFHFIVGLKSCVWTRGCLMRRRTLSDCAI